ncbi:MULTISPECIES: bifunctional metallophosphatase/5'-nucleotidase [Bacillaceae]|uniref:bifunctional metallophosphatase/5'-nucleotidase n=1 Tax=Bacillaceae TaxID=186817 RepID=UPI00069DDEE9|nr:MULTISPECIES: bifunctional metallophosphatase/5'-nucleotidase [Bacillaceae]MCF7624663.1 bifunctional metallophosphatase/5'-nucleotidase [Peribacillus frigoritolerans]MCP1155206.1 bifunctional metallophosphatase/5'-nucleotidase [Peribacillus frigoritolerans]MCT1389960.1 bifunctional metallophosphatase/5'-nucleotidase [Peribacillus frigoritolerans]PRA95572.1 bifunctional metallophosphatase/5'-nucleotidase [Peribacillus simplex]
MSKFQAITSLFILVFIIIFVSYKITAFSSNHPTTNHSTSNRYIQLQLLGVNDFHGQLNKYQLVSGTMAGGAEYLAAYLKKYKQENPNTLLVHAGDMVGGSPPISSQFQDEPTIEFLNLLHFDVGTPGNHELDEGVNEMKRLIHGGFNKKTGYFQGANTAYSSANIIDRKSGLPLLPPYVIKQMDGIDIGFIGVVTKETNMYVSPENRKEVEITDEVSAINRTVKILKDKGIKVIVVLAHNSAKSEKAGANSTGALMEMAPKIDDEVDVIFAGHSHEYANTVAAGKLIVQAYSNGKAFSQVNLEIDPHSKIIVKKQAKIIATSHQHIKPDEETVALLNKYRKRLGSKFNQVIGEMPEEIRRNQDANGESPLAKMIAESEREAMGVDIAFVHQGEMRKSLKKGKITVEDLYTNVPMGHSVSKLILTGEQIKLALEQQWTKEYENRLQTVGLTYDWEAKAPIGSKVVVLKDKKGQEIQPNNEYEVAVSNYLASGGDNFTAFEQGRLVESGPQVVTALIRHIQQKYPPHSLKE